MFRAALFRFSCISTQDMVHYIQLQITMKRGRSISIRSEDIQKNSVTRSLQILSENVISLSRLRQDLSKHAIGLLPGDEAADRSA